MGATASVPDASSRLTVLYNQRAGGGDHLPPCAASTRCWRSDVRTCNDDECCIFRTSSLLRHSVGRARCCDGWIPRVASLSLCARHEGCRLGIRHACRSGHWDFLVYGSNVFTSGTAIRRQLAMRQFVREVDLAGALDRRLSGPCPIRGLGISYTRLS